MDAHYKVNGDNNLNQYSHQGALNWKITIRSSADCIHCKNYTFNLYIFPIVTISWQLFYLE